MPKRRRLTSSGLPAVVAAVIVTAGAASCGAPAAAPSERSAQPSTAPAAPPTSTHFRLEPLADGVWAVWATPSGHLTCNLAIVDLGGETLVFDAGASIEAAAQVRAAAEALTGRPVRWLVLSHGHADNSRGTYAYDERTVILAAPGTAGLMTKEAARFAAAKATYPPLIPPLRARAADAPTEAERVDAAFRAGLLEALLEPNFHVRLPDRAASSLTLRGTKRSVALHALRGHTDDDVVAVVPDARLAITGGIFFPRSHPYFVDGDPDALVQSLDALERFGADRYLGAYGTLGGPADVDVARRYVRAMQSNVQAGIAAGEPLDQQLARGVPEPFKGLLHARFYEPNYKYLHRRASERSSAAR